ncbi:hypothetical protein [Kosakonia cowanii]|uniref:AbiTii domain-containing protein n=1 Tax=Kosakonia cowanii TaxID=208223 RepID=UPI00345C0862
MNEPMVIRFQRMAMSNETTTPDLLRMAKAIAVKLQLKDVCEWIDYELNGYPPKVTVPDYRITRGKLLGRNPQRGLIPMEVSNAKQEEKLSTVHIGAPVSELAMAYSMPNAIMDFPFSSEFSNSLQLNQPEFLRFPILRRIGQTKMLNVVEQVRNRLLDWSLALEQQGILGENLQFSQQDKNRAPMTTNHFNFNGNINNAGVIGADNHDFKQQNTLQITAGDFDALRACLESMGFAPADVQELKTVLDSEPAPAVSDRVLPKVYAWLGRAGERVLDTGLEKAAPAAIEAISKYLGF